MEVLDDVPVGLNDSVIFRGFLGAIRCRSTTRHQAVSCCLAACGFSLVVPVDDALGAHGHRKPVVNADIPRPHLRASPKAFVAVTCLEFRQVEGFPGGI